MNNSFNQRVALDETGKVYVIDEAEYRDILEKYKQQYKGVIGVMLKVEEGYLCAKPVFEPFERIRRITGYLVGTMEHWNNAKSSEEKDRVKHKTNSDMERI